MSLKGLAPMFMALFVIANTGAAFASPPASGKTDTAETGNLGEALTVLHAVGQWSIDLSKMADKRAKSDLVKNYARDDGDCECGYGRQAHGDRQEKWDRGGSAGPENRGGQEPARPHQGRNAAARALSREMPSTRNT